jgi:hypothetical protein
MMMISATEKFSRDDSDNTFPPTKSTMKSLTSDSLGVSSIYNMNSFLLFSTILISIDSQEIRLLLFGYSHDP